MSTFYETPRRSDEIYHHGVVGMKWGVHRYKRLMAKGKVDKAKKVLDRTYSKASKRLDVIDRQAEKLQRKATKFRMKADNKKYGFFSNAKKAAKLDMKSGKKQNLANKKYQKGSKFYKHMEKSFRDTPIKLSSKQNATGKKFADRMVMRSMSGM